MHPISFFRPTSADIFARVEIKALQGYTSAVGEEIRTAVAAYINEIEIGDPVYLTRLFLPANLNGSVDSATFDITDLQIGTSPGSLSPASVVIGFNTAAACSPDNIEVVVVWVRRNIKSSSRPITSPNSTTIFPLSPSH